MSRLHPIRFALVLSIMLAGLSASAQRAPLPDRIAPRIASRPAFATLKIFVDPHGKPLAVYQFELIAQGEVTIVGLEAGEVRGFSEPPYYDRAALAGGRIVVGAYSLAGELPAGRSHVATLHVRIGGTAEPKYQVKLITAGGRDGKPISADVSIQSDRPIQEGVQP